MFPPLRNHGQERHQRRRAGAVLIIPQDIRSCTPQFMQGLQAGFAQLGAQQGAQGAGGGPQAPGGVPPGPATGGMNMLPATAGVPTQLPPGAPPLPQQQAAGPPGGMATGAGGGAPLPQQGRAPLPGGAPVGGAPGGMGQGQPGMPPAPAPPPQVAGAQQPGGYNPNMPPGAGVRGFGMPQGPQGQLPMRPNALPRRSLRR